MTASAPEAHLRIWVGIDSGGNGVAPYGIAPAQAVGTSVDRLPNGTFDHYAAWSTYPSVARTRISNFPVAQGEGITARVRALSNYRYEFTITNATGASSRPRPRP